MRSNPIKQLSEEDLNRKEIKLQKIKGTIKYWAYHTQKFL